MFNRFFSGAKTAISHHKLPFQISKKALFLGAASAASFTLYQISQPASRVIDKSILANNPQSLNVVPYDQFSSAGRKKNKSKTEKVQKTNSKTGKTEYFYRKNVSSRKELINELIVGALGNALFPENFPEVYLVEQPLQNGQCQFKLLSRIVAENASYGNVHEWGIYYIRDHQAREFAPKVFLGVSVAFDLLIGKQTSFSNIIHIRDKQNSCYSVDHKFAFSKPPVFLESADEALKQIQEFNSDTLYRNDPTVHTLISKAIEQDISTGRVNAFYEKFAALSEKELKKIIEQFGFLTTDETVKHMEILNDRQNTVKMFLKNKDLSLNQSLKIS